MPVIIDEHTQYTDINGKPFVNGKVFIGVVNQDPVLNPEPIFSDPELTVPIANPQLLNSRGQTVNKIFVAAQYSFKLENSLGTQIEQDLERGTAAGAEGPLLLDNVAGINAITATADPTIVNYVDKQQYSLTLANTNTGSPVTLKIDGAPVIDVKDKGVDIQTGQFLANRIIIVSFNSIGPSFDLVSGVTLSSPSPIGDVIPNTIGGTDITASGEFDGALGTTNAKPAKVTTIEATTSIKVGSGATLTQFDNGSITTNSPTRGVTQQSVVNFAPQKGVNGIVQGDIANGAVGQGELITSTGDVSTSVGSTLLTGPGGEYGFYPTLRASVNPGFHMAAFVSPIPATTPVGNILTTLGTSFLQRFHLGIQGTGAITARSRFVQASPPYDIGDGDVHSFIFAIVGSNGKVESMYHAPDPPWANNGPTCIKPEYFRGEKYTVEERVKYINKKGKEEFKLIQVEKERNIKPYRQVCVIDRSKDFQDPARKSKYEQEITNDFKNSDMPLIPHPFQGNDMNGKSIILIDPCSDIVRIAEEMKEDGELASEELFFKDYVRFGNEHLAGRATPHKDVMVVKPTWKNSK